jgi:hypothetical protein
MLIYHQFLKYVSIYDFKIQKYIYELFNKDHTLRIHNYNIDTLKLIKEILDKLFLEKFDEPESIEKCKNIINELIKLLYDIYYIYDIYYVSKYISNYKKENKEEEIRIDNISNLLYDELQKNGKVHENLSYLNDIYY